MLEHIETNKTNKQLLEGDTIDKIYEVFIKEQEENFKDFEIKRLKNEEAINYYKKYMEYNRKILKERIKQQYDYFKSIKDDPEKRVFYIGESYGEFAKQTDDYEDRNKPVYIDLETKDDKTLLNLAIAKLKIEDDFISYKLSSFVTVLLKIGLIDEDEYNEFIYGTTDINKLNLIKKGLSISLVNRLNEDNQLENLRMDEYNNLLINDDLKNYISELDDYERFEIEKYI